MKNFFQKPKVLYLSVAVLVGGLCWTPKAEATTVESYSPAQSSLYSQFNLFEGSHIQDVWIGLLEDGLINMIIDSRARVSGFLGDDTVYLPLTRSRGEIVFTDPEAITGGSSATNYGNTYQGSAHGPPGEGNPLKNAVATRFHLPSRGTSVDDGATWRVLSTRLGTLFLLWDNNYFDDPGNSYGYRPWDGTAFWRYVIGRPNGTQLWPENPAPLPRRMILYVAGLTGVLAWRMKKAQQA